jgi:hypothetical protein
VRRDGFVYAFRDRETGDVISAYSGESGPALGGAAGGSDEELSRIASSVDAFAALMDATEPAACQLEFETDYGRARVGVRAGEWFEESVD